VVANLVGDLRLDQRLAAQVRLWAQLGGPGSASEPPWAFATAGDVLDTRLSPELSARRAVPGGLARATITGEQLGFYKDAAVGFLGVSDKDIAIGEALLQAVRLTVPGARNADWEVRASANLAYYLAVCCDAVAHHANASEPALAGSASWMSGVLRCELVILTTAVVAQATTGGLDAGRVLARIAWNRDSLAWIGHISRLDPIAARLLAAFEATPEVPTERLPRLVGAASEQLAEAKEHVRRWRLSVLGSSSGLIAL